MFSRRGSSAASTFHKAALLLAASTLTIGSAAHAADTNAADTTLDAAEAEQIVVIGQRLGYDAKTSATATKTETRLVDVPQSVSVITGQQIDDQALRSMSDVLRYVPGATAAQGE